MTHVRRIGLLTSGGDCAGLNAAIRAVVIRATQHHGIRVLGIREGTAGLLQRPPAFQELDAAFASGPLLRAGGTVLGTVNRGDPFAFPMPDGSQRDRSAEVIEAIRSLELDALIGIGGDGSLRILGRLAAQGAIPFVGIPKTIDNDVAGTDFAIGWMTAVDIAVESLDRLQPTAASHRRVMLLEVMGRTVGWIALAAGIAGGADVILLPEIPYRMDAIIEKVRQLHALGRTHALVVVAEGVPPPAEDAGKTLHAGVSHLIAERIERATGAESRVTELGYVQRGGSPCPLDRVLASSFGTRAVDLVAAGETNRVVVWQSGRVGDVALEEVAGKTRGVDPEGSLVRTARQMGICLGD